MVSLLHRATVKRHDFTIQRQFGLVLLPGIINLDNILGFRRQQVVHNPTYTIQTLQKIVLKYFPYTKCFDLYEIFQTTVHVTGVALLQFTGSTGSTENARHETTAQSKMQGREL